MNRDPMDDTGSFTVGVVLQKMRAASEDEIRKALILQEENSEMLGKILVAEGIITQVQLDDALQTQKDLRSKKKHVRALAAARLAETSIENVSDFANKVEELTEDTKRKTTGRGHPVITDDMLDK